MNRYICSDILYHIRREYIYIVSSKREAFVDCYDFEMVGPRDCNFLFEYQDEQYLFLGGKVEWSLDYESDYNTETDYHHTYYDLNTCDDSFRDPQTMEEKMPQNTSIFNYSYYPHVMIEFAETISRKYYIPLYYY